MPGAGEEDVPSLSQPSGDVLDVERDIESWMPSATTQAVEVLAKHPQLPSQPISVDDLLVSVQPL